MQCSAAIWMGRRIASRRNVTEPLSIASSNMFLLLH
jgi:hypothetical protein